MKNKNKSAFEYFNFTKTKWRMKMKTRNQHSNLDFDIFLIKLGSNFKLECMNFRNIILVNITELNKCWILNAF